MSASRSAVASYVPFLLRKATRADLKNSALLSYYFVSAAPGIGRDLEATAMRAFLSARKTRGRTELFAADMDGAAGCLILEDKPWDSAMLSVATKSLTLVVGLSRGRSRSEIASRMLESSIDIHSGKSAGLVTTRIPADDTELLQALEDHGFRVVVPMVTLGKTIEKSKFTFPRGTSISALRPEDIDQIERIAATAFLWGRFSADPLVPAGAAEKVHRTWARNCCLGTHAKHVLVARKGREVLGFIALKFQKAGAIEVGSIELIATSEASRGMGIGRALVQAGCNWLSTSVVQVVVRTELPNVSALRMYEAQGFRVLNGSLYLSHWQGGATTHLAGK
jgi:dTDP-4-amino-4,6-dideoxy-D-galactose acyltransferase